jgi:hypothetical protein
MNRLAGIIVAALGLIIALLSILRVLPGITGLGVSLILLGGLIIGLSFVDKPADPDETPRMSTPSTLINIFFSPADVFRNLRRHPRWLAAILIMSVLWAVFGNLFLYRLTPERVTNHQIDKTLEMSFLPEEARQDIEKSRAPAIEQQKDPVQQGAKSITEFIWYGVFGTGFLALIFFLFTLVMGGRMNYWQAFSATAYAWFPYTVIRSILNIIVLFLKDPAEIHPILGANGALIQDNLGFLVVPADNPAIYVLLASLSITSFYWIWLQATGLKNTGEKVSSTVAWSATIGTWAIGLVLGMLMATLFPSFMS